MKYSYNNNHREPFILQNIVLKVLHSVFKLQIILRRVRPKNIHHENHENLHVRKKSWFENSTRNLCLSYHPKSMTSAYRFTPPRPPPFRRV